MKSRLSATFVSYVCLTFGLLFSFVAYARYWSVGYSVATGLFLLFGVLLLACSFYDWRPQRLPNNLITRYWKVGLVAVVLLALFIPLYTSGVYTFPWQVNTDEIVIMNLAKKLTAVAHPDIFGLSGHFDFPALSFIITGWGANILGGIDLLHVRIFHGLVAALIVILGFFFFRMGMPTWLAAVTSTVMGTNHAFFMISRMAMRENSAVLIELIALIVLWLGWKRSSLLFTFVGGVGAGLSFYMYSPARITVFVWAAFIAVSLLFGTKMRNRIAIVQYALVAGFGAVVIALPLLIATVKMPAGFTQYSHQQILVYAEGRQFQQTWVNAPTVMKGLLHNYRNGLLMFNTAIHDYGYIYPNYGHGFVDRATGVLLWIGFLYALFRIYKKSKESDMDVLMVSGFLVSWAVFIFLLAKTPNYTRLLVLLPFVAYFAVLGMRFFGAILIGVSRKVDLKIRTWLLYALPVIVLLPIVVYFNAAISYDFFSIAKAHGQDVGSTARYVEARSHVPTLHFYLAADASYPYYSWAEPNAWVSWFKIFTVPSQSTEIISPSSLSDYFVSARPFTVLMSGPLWAAVKSDFMLRYPYAHVQLITPDGGLLAVEVDSY